MISRRDFEPAVITSFPAAKYHPSSETNCRDLPLKFANLDGVPGGSEVIFFKHWQVVRQLNDLLKWQALRIVPWKKRPPVERSDVLTPRTNLNQDFLCSMFCIALQRKQMVTKCQVLCSVLDIV